MQILIRPCVRRWAQVFTDGRMPLECGTGQRLILTNVTYEQQGQYMCLASNKINGNVREVKSDPVSLQVVGAPRVRSNVENIFLQIRIIEKRKIDDVDKTFSFQYFPINRHKKYHLFCGIFNYYSHDNI